MHRPPFASFNIACGVPHCRSLLWVLLSAHDVINLFWCGDWGISELNMAGAVPAVSGSCLAAFKFWLPLPHLHAVTLHALSRCSSSVNIKRVVQNDLSDPDARPSWSVDFLFSACLPSGTGPVLCAAVMLLSVFYPLSGTTTKLNADIIIRYNGIAKNSLSKTLWLRPFNPYLCTLEEYCMTPAHLLRISRSGTVLANFPDRHSLV